MINLLADDKKAEIRAGRVNVILLNYIFMLIAAVVLLVVIITGAYLTLNIGRASAQARVDHNSQDTASYKTVQDQATTYRNNLATAKQVLDKEVTYSRLIVKIAQAVPSGVILDQLSLDSTTIGKATTLTARAHDQTAAISLKTSFENQPKLFSDVHIEQLQFDKNSTNNYPVTVTLGLTINKESLQ